MRYYHIYINYNNLRKKKRNAYNRRYNEGCVEVNPIAGLPQINTNQGRYRTRKNRIFMQVVISTLSKHHNVLYNPR